MLNSSTLSRFRRWKPQIRTRYLAAAVAALAVSLVYVPVLGAGFVWDDNLLFIDLVRYRSPTALGDAIFQPFALSPNYFRPLVVFIFVAELWAWGLWPAPFHLTNLLLHACNTALVTRIAAALQGDDWQGEAGAARGAPTIVALVAGLLYGLHPALIEGVAFVSSRFDLALTTFLLLALWFDLRLRGQTLARTVLVCVMFFLATLSKEMAASFVLVLPAWHLATRDRTSWRQRIWVYAGILVTGILSLLLRSLSLGTLYDPQGGPTIPTGNTLQHFLLVARSLWEYVLLTLLPFGLLSPIHWSELPIPSTSVSGWSALVGVLGVLLGVIWLVRRAPRVGWVVVAFLVALLPVINIVPLELGGGAFVAERYLQFPLALATCAVAMALPTVVRPRVRILIGVWLIVCVATVQMVVPRWRDELALWNWGIQSAPRSSMPFTNLALELIRRHDYPGALAASEQAIALEPQSASGIDNRGLALFHLGRYEEAQQAFEAALKIEPRNALYWNNLAGALREQGKLQEAERMLRDEVLTRAPDLPVAYVNLGLVYLRADRPDLAAQHLEQALRLLPPGEIDATQALLDQTADPQRWLRLGYLLLENAEPQAALDAFARASELNAAPIDVIVGRSSALIAQEQWADAEIILQGALSLGVDDARVFNNLGILAAQRGDTDAATVFYARAAELAPEWQAPQDNLKALDAP